MTTLDEIQERADAASKELDRLAGGNPGTNWRWSIPAQPDRDTDLILGASQMDVPRLLAALRAVEAVAAPTGDDYTFDLGYAAALDKVRNTIREALGC